MRRWVFAIKAVLVALLAALRFSVFHHLAPKTCVKLSMKVKINHTDDDLKFHGLKKLQFHAMNTDASLMRERLSYYLFREMGIPAHVQPPCDWLSTVRWLALFAG